MAGAQVNLTPAQKIAIEFTDKDILVSAGAGSGKTHVLVERFLNFVISGKAKVTEILALTFTDKAANEMKVRMLRRFQKEGMLQASRELEMAYISTIHAFAARLLKEHPIEAQVPPDFSVLASEEADLMQDEVLDSLIEVHCTPGSGVFDLLKTYGESRLREGLKKIFEKARVEGLSLQEFFAQPLPNANLDAAKISALFEKAGETTLAEEWNRFAAATWDWDTVQGFREWSANFGRKGGKTSKELWKEIAASCKLWTAQKIETFMAPWRQKFEAFALAFEAAYEARKFQESVLDFEDLQLRALQLLTSPHPGCRKVLEYYRHAFKFILVDEYQDVNPLQVRLIECLASESMNGKMFYVGDYKQSIYGFRGTSPNHFLQKEKEYEAGRGVLIPMMENFRTQANVLHFVNAFFERLWEEEGLKNIGLIPQVAAEEEKKVELLKVHRAADEDLNQARLREAGAIAYRIQEFKEAGVEYGKMAILFQTVTNMGIYEYALKAAGIPYFVVSGKGFYHQPEIRDVISLLTVIENPLLDIPLAAALRSPFFRLSDDDLFWLSLDAKKGDDKAPLSHALKHVQTIEGLSDNGRQQLHAARNFFEKCVKEKDRLYLSELLEWILKETGYELTVLADRQGVRRYANLRKLVHMAREKETRLRLSLGDFIRLVRNLESKEVREAEAQVEAEQSGRVVRLMTIHAAKGLEFPVCFVADLACRDRSAESGFVAEGGLGYSFEIPNELTQDREKPYSYQRIREAIEERETREWKRLFYVAATRAQSKLILSGVFEEKKEKKTSFCEMSSWMEWVTELAPEMPMEIREISENAQGLVRRPAAIYADDLLKAEGGRWKVEENVPVLPSALQLPPSAFEVSPGRVLDLPVSAYCAFAKDKLQYWRVYEMGYKDRAPEWERPENPDEEYDGSAADFGTKIHKVFELLDFKDPEPRLERILAEVFIAEEARQIPEARKLVQAFINSESFKKLQSAKKIYRELRFVRNERHGRIDGVIDLLFQDAQGAWHILDYKTAVGDDQKVKDAAYDLQIAIYASAVSEILGVAPQSGILVFLKNNWVSTLPISEAFLKEQTERLQKMQQEMMDYRNALIKMPG